MAAAEDSVIKYMSDNPGASVTQISDFIVSSGADLDTVADMAGVSRADARAAFSPTPAPASNNNFNMLNDLTLAGNMYSALPASPEAPAGVGPNSPYALSAADNTADNTPLMPAGNAVSIGSQIAQKALVPDSISAGDISTNILNSVTGPDADSSDKTKAFFAATDALNAVIPGIGLFTRLIDAMDIFGGGGMEATPMTPEERELNDAAAKVDMALGLAEKASTSGIASEGMSPDVYLLDALNTVNALPDSGLEFFGDTKDQLLDKLISSGVDSSTSSQGVKGKWQDTMTGEVLPNFNPNTGSGMGTSGYYPTFIPDETVTDSGGGGDTSSATDATSDASLDNELLNTDSALNDTTQDAVSDSGAANSGSPENPAGLKKGDIVTDDRIVGNFPFIFDAESGLFHYAPFNDNGDRIFTGDTIDANTVEGFNGADVATGQTAGIMFEPDTGQPILEHDGSKVDSTGTSTVNTTSDLIPIAAGDPLFDALVIASNKNKTSTAGGITDGVDTTGNVTGDATGGVTGGIAGGVDTTTGVDTTGGGDTTGVDTTGVDTTGGDVDLDSDLNKGKGTATEISTGTGPGTGLGTGPGTGDGDGDGDGDGNGNGNINLFSAIQKTPVVSSILFEPQFTKLDNIHAGMFERFMRAAGGK
tara:strand:+ start:295 stop:2238 length:1944 start_codon:yes stop_codon:yes gene_type:complete